MISVGTLGGMPIFVDKYCYTTDIRVKGTVDSRRPNCRKPLYKKVVVHTPRMYLAKGIGIFAHPSIVSKLKEQYEKVSV